MKQVGWGGITTNLKTVQTKSCMNPSNDQLIEMRMWVVQQHVANACKRRAEPVISFPLKVPIDWAPAQLSQLCHMLNLNEWGWPNDTNASCIEWIYAWNEPVSISPLHCAFLYANCLFLAGIVSVFWYFYLVNHCLYLHVKQASLEHAVLNCSHSFDSLEVKSLRAGKSVQKITSFCFLTLLFNSITYCKFKYPSSST